MLHDKLCAHGPIVEFDGRTLVPIAHKHCDVDQVHIWRQRGRWRWRWWVRGRLPLKRFGGTSRLTISTITRIVCIGIVQPICSIAAKWALKRVSCPAIGPDCVEESLEGPHALWLIPPAITNATVHRSSQQPD